MGLFSVTLMKDVTYVTFRPNPKGNGTAQNVVRTTQKAMEQPIKEIRITQNVVRTTHLGNTKQNLPLEPQQPR